MNHYFKQLLLSLLLVVSLTGCSMSSGESSQNTAGSSSGEDILLLEEIPEYDGDPYVEINDNVPQFTEDEITDESFEEYSELDELGRCGVVVASVGQDLMPTQKRGSIGQVKPTGWQTVKYDFVDGKYLYNRCHLIGYQLTAENANWSNLITGTRYMNVDGMLPFENMVADYVKETDNHVMYRVTPVFEGENLVASGVQMEAYSVEDEGDGISFNVYAYNVQPDVEIDYATGESRLAETESSEAGTLEAIRGNSRSRIYHCPGQAAYDEMEESRYLVLFTSEEEAQQAGYRKAKR
jgi:DNA-entry nuclease